MKDQIAFLLLLGFVLMRPVALPAEAVRRLGIKSSGRTDAWAAEILGAALGFVGTEKAP
jgi:hypothetical protein